MKRMEPGGRMSQGNPVGGLLIKAFLAGILVICLGAVAGCGQKGSEPEAPLAGQDTETSPEAKTAASLRAGSVSLDGLLETLQETQSEIVKLKADASPELKEGLIEIEEMMASAADAAAEFKVEPPTEQQVKADFATFDDQRLKAITELNDALVDLRSAQGTAASIAEEFEKYGPLADLLGLAVSDLEDAIKAFGGTPQEDQEAEPEPGIESGDPNGGGSPE